MPVSRRSCIALNGVMNLVRFKIRGHTGVAIDVTWCSIPKPQYIRVKTQNTMRSGAVSVGHLQVRTQPKPRRNNKRTHRVRLGEDDSVQIILEQIDELAID